MFNADKTIHGFFSTTICKCVATMKNTTLKTKPTTDTIIQLMLKLKKNQMQRNSGTFNVIFRSHTRKQYV